MLHYKFSSKTKFFPLHDRWRITGFYITSTVFMIEIESAWSQTCSPVCEQGKWLQLPVALHDESADRKRRARKRERERAPMKMFQMPNFQFLLSQYCVRLGSVVTAQAATTFPKERESFWFLLFFSSPTFSPHFWNSNKGCIWLVTHHGPAPVIQVPRVFPPDPSEYCSHPALWVVWFDPRERALALTGAPLCTPLCCQVGCNSGGPTAELFLPIRTLCTKALKQPPLWHDDNVQFHTASWRLTVYYVCKSIFQQIVILDSFTTVQFLSFWENPSEVYIAVTYEPESPIFL